MIEFFVGITYFMTQLRIFFIFFNKVTYKVHEFLMYIYDGGNWCEW